MNRQVVNSRFNVIVITTGPQIQPFYRKNNLYIKFPLLFTNIVAEEYEGDS